jgi:hypothetical protein
MFAAAGIAVCGSNSGCALFNSDETMHTAAKTPLKPLTPQFDAIQLDVSFVERPQGDPLLGPALWSELDEISTLDGKTLTTLHENGVRFGIASSNPPRSLMAAIEIAEQANSYSGRRYAQQSGQEMTINAWGEYPSCRITIPGDGGTIVQEYKYANCTFRVIPTRLQDGWVRIEFIPEIHHGEMKMRKLPGEQNWKHLPSQLVDPLYGQRFSVELNVGELVVLSAAGDDPQSVGHHFFRGGTTDSKLQRLLIVRVADMQRLDPVYE